MTFKKTIVALAGLGSAFGLVASLSTPVDTAGWSTIGGSLGGGQRDFRVFNNFSDAAANNNTTPNSAFPGVLGATQAIWKGHLEWASGWYLGTGTQDPTQQRLGTGRANFDNSFQGEANSIGGSNANMHAELLDETPGSTLAFMQGPISDGWIIRYLSGWLWQDGPGSNGSVDLQGVACHEVGHSLGLGHSTVSGATMYPSISGSGVNQRSINSDDAAGIRSIYGDAAANKPLILAISGNTSIGGTLVITGENFSTTNNTVWFTDANADGTSVNVTGVSSSNGGTQLTLTVPSGIQDGSIVVKGSFSGGASISNEWAFEIGGMSGDPPVISSITPTSGPQGGWTEVTIAGIGFNGTTDVEFDGVPALSFTVDSPSQITAVTPGGPFGFADVSVTDDESTFNLTNGFSYVTNPVPDVSSISPGTGPAAGGTTVTISGSTVVGTSVVRFDGVPGTNLTITSGTTLEVDVPAGLGSVDVDVFNNSGVDSLAGGFTFQPAGNFNDLGPGIASSTLGFPTLSGSGDLTPGSLASFTLEVTNSQPFALSYLLVSDQNNPTSGFGGTIYPLPPLDLVLVGLDGSGGLSAALTMPANVPSGVEIYLQFVIGDATGPQGLTATNGLGLEIP